MYLLKATFKKTKIKLLNDNLSIYGYIKNFILLLLYNEICY